MTKEEFNNYVKQLWNANHSDAIAKILHEFQSQLQEDKGGKVPTDEEIEQMSLQGRDQRFVDPINRSGWIEGAKATRDTFLSNQKPDGGKMYGCYSGNKLLRIYTTESEAEKERPRWSAEYVVKVREVKIGDGCA